MFSALLFMFFCFFGILAALFYLSKRQEHAWQLLRDEHAQLRVLLRALESRLEYLAAVTLDPEQTRRAHDPARGETAPEITDPQQPFPAEGSGRDPLLRLSFEEPGTPHASSGARTGHDPALELHFDPAGVPAPDAGRQRGM